MVPRAGLGLKAASLLTAVLAIAFAAYCAAAQTAAKAAPAATRAGTQPADRVLLLVNDNSLLSRDIAEYYARRRGVPRQNICRVKASTGEEISHEDYDRQIARPIGAFLRKNGLQESIYYIVTTAGVPLKISGAGEGMSSSAAAVDSELALLYSDLKTGKPHRDDGSIPNPFFAKRDRPFSHPEYPIYLVTRLAAYDFDGVKGMIERSLAATNRGKFVLDLRGPDDESGNDWLRNAAILLPKDRVVLEETTEPVYGQTDVIGYASWGSNDRHHERRFPGFHWLPGGIVTEYVSTDGRTFVKPPDSWTPSMDWSHRSAWFAGSPQSMLADYIFEGASGASGHVYEPYLNMTPRPDLLLPAYYSGRNLAESYYLAIPALSWQNVVVGDPLCALGPPAH
ncbi:MAG TPA: TIGR03790 family protein [Bryobacteraceae bacterium]|nr:TIGR03790 family protein [Bryobacteraceae bacterium]